jgi:tetratricopeptide (TPR) repeat protein
MSPANRVRLIVGALAVVAAGVVVGVVYATRQTPAQPSAQCKRTPSPYIVPGTPRGNLAAVRAALKLEPVAAARALEQLAFNAPKDPVVQFNYATALFCAGYVADADAAYRAAKKAGRDTYYEIQADLILHPQYFTKAGYPPFLSESRDPLLVRGAILQRAGHQRSAQRVWEKAARLHPGSDEAQVAAAVGRFDMDDLSASFSRLGPLVRTFPKSQSVRYHLGLLLAWTGQRDQAITEFRLARSLGPRTVLGKEANSFLRGLVASGTNGTQR